MTPLPTQPVCPAAEYEQSVYGIPPGVRCRIRGSIRDAEGSPCIGGYAGEGSRPPCAIWKGEKLRVWAHLHPERMQKANTPDGWKTAA